MPRYRPPELPGKHHWKMLAAGEIAACGPFDPLTRLSDTLFLSEAANAA
jgi:hypothetical protein